MPRTVDVTELILRDAHQSLLATRLALEDMVPACEDLDGAGFWSIECWGGATFDACIRFLNEDPWERLRTFRRLRPRARLQMLLRGQNLLGYRHYEDSVGLRLDLHQGHGGPVMGAEGAAEIVFRKEIQEASDKPATRSELIARYREAFSTPYVATGRRLVDNAIDPALTRRHIAQTLEYLQTKRELRPPKKHGLMPL